MPQDESSKILDPCPNCATLIDVTDCEPFSEIHCPACGSKMRVRRQFNNFALQQVIGEGGMGTVFEALDVNLVRPVALKILKKEYSLDGENIAKLETEARITASINHPHVVKVFSAGWDHGQFYLAMELVSKGTLDQLMNLQVRVAEIQVLDVGIQIADGLRAALQQGLIHRDVKPGNILFSDAHTSKIVDFGLALLMEDEAKARGEIWGTPYYVAPEKLNNEPEDFRSDIYSLGGTLFHAISGRPPFEAASASLVALKHLKSQAVSLQAFAPDVSNETAYVINRMLHKDPMQRYQSYEELIEHLNYAKSKLLERSATGHKPKVRVVVETEETKTFAGWIGLALILVLIGTGIFIWIKRESIFGAPVKPVVTETQTTGPTPLQEAAASYDEGRQLLAKEDFPGAMSLFKQVAGTPDLPQPQLNWALAHQGLALVLAGQFSEAKEIFAKMQSDGLYSTAPDQSLLANFFVEMGRLMKDGKSIPGRTREIYDNTNFEAFALLIYAMKDWQLGKFADAGALLEKFSNGQPVEEYRWMEDYKPLAGKYLTDFRTYRLLQPVVDAANTPQGKTGALKLVREAKARLLTQGSLPELFNQWEGTLSVEVTSNTQETQARDEALLQEAARQEKKEWQQYQPRIIKALWEFSPETLLAELQTRQPRQPENVEAQNLALKKLQWLASAKEELLKKLNGNPATIIVTSRRGAVIKGGIAGADATTLNIRNPYGSTPVLWKDVHPDSLAALINALLPGTGENPEAARKKWLVGVIYMVNGMENKGRQFLIEAGQMDPQWRDELAVFFPATDQAAGS